MAVRKSTGSSRAVLRSTANDAARHWSPLASSPEEVKNAIEAVLQPLVPRAAFERQHHVCGLVGNDRDAVLGFRPTVGGCYQSNLGPLVEHRMFYERFGYAVPIPEYDALPQSAIDDRVNDLVAEGRVVQVKGEENGANSRGLAWPDGNRQLRDAPVVFLAPMARWSLNKTLEQTKSLTEDLRALQTAVECGVLPSADRLSLALLRVEHRALACDAALLDHGKTLQAGRTTEVGFSGAAIGALAGLNGPTLHHVVVQVAFEAMRTVRSLTRKRQEFAWPDFTRVSSELDKEAEEAKDWANGRGHAGRAPFTFRMVDLLEYLGSHLRLQRAAAYGTDDEPRVDPVTGDITWRVAPTLTEERDAATWGHPLFAVTDRIAKLLGLRRQNLDQLALRLGTHARLDWWPTRSDGLDDLTHILADLRNLDVDGTTEEFLAWLWESHAAVADAAGIPRPKAAGETARIEGLKKSDLIAIAISRLVQNPALSQKDLAKQVGLSESTLSRSVEFQRARAAAKQTRVPRRGTKYNGNVEAVDGP